MTTTSSTTNANVAAVNAQIAAAQAAGTGSSTTSAVGSTTGTTASLDALGSNFTDFISLLTTQLQNQDPTDPTDTNQFTQELIGFSQVQQSVDTNTNLTSLINLTQNAGVNNSIGYINQLVDATTNQVNILSGKPTPTIGYTLPANTATSTVTITDSAGNVVDTINGATTVGKQTLTWNGTDSSGNALPNGDYTVTVAAADSTGAALTGATTDVTDYVSSVGYANGASTLYFGDIAVPATNVISVVGYYGQPQTATSGTSGTAPSA